MITIDTSFLNNDDDNDDNNDNYKNENPIEIYG